MVGRASPTIETTSGIRMRVVAGSCEAMAFNTVVIAIQTCVNRDNRSYATEGRGSGLCLLPFLFQGSKAQGGQMLSNGFFCAVNFLVEKQVG